MADAEAFSSLGPEEAADEVLQDDVPLEDMLADTNVAQLMIKEAIAPRTEWAATLMDGAWSEGVNEHCAEPQDRALRATKAHITYEAYVSGLRPSSRVLCN